MSEQHRLITEQIPLALALARADQGIERAASHAERVLPGWCDRAAEAVRQALLRTRLDDTFTIEQLRGAIATADLLPLPDPPDARAWGHVTRRAVKLGYVERLPGQYRAAVSSNGSPKPLYRRGPNT